jgi:hypothetical protein
MSAYAPTGQQQACIDAALRGETFVAQARAGAGKTTTARQIALALPGKKILYVAFNKSTQVEAKNSFPTNVDARTSHSLAWWMGRKYTHRMLKPMGSAKRVPAWQAAQQLGVSPVTIADKELDGAQLVRLALAAVARFSRSADRELNAYHVRWVKGLEGEHEQVVRVVLPLARRCWQDIRSGRVLNVAGEHYIKMWQLTSPKLSKYDVIIFDEAQDANGAVADVIERQSCQKIYIGDSAQAINGWNGAVDFLARATVDASYPLSQSFRFGQAVADAGNDFLRIMGEPTDTLLTGFDKISSTIEKLDDPDAILCRTNAGVVTVALDQLGKGRKVAIVGGADSIIELAEAAAQLQAGAKTSHPDLAAFRSWAEVQAYVKEDEGADLRPFVKIIDELSAEAVIESLRNLTAEKYADVVVSTAHKAKGREWKRVRVHTDFPEPKPLSDGSKGHVSREMAMLAYVTLTRAQLVLDDEGLAWRSEYLPEGDTAEDDYTRAVREFAEISKAAGDDEAEFAKLEGMAAMGIRLAR